VGFFDSLEKCLDKLTLNVFPYMKEPISDWFMNTERLPKGSVNSLVITGLAVLRLV
jgi:hypothetical protein